MNTDDKLAKSLAREMKKTVIKCKKAGLSKDNIMLAMADAVKQVYEELLDISSVEKENAIGMVQEVKKSIKQGMN